MKVKEFLADRGREMLKLRRDERVSDAALRFSHSPEGRKYSLAVVVDDGDRLAGVFSLGDIVFAFGTLKAELLAKTVGDIMTTKVAVAKAEDDLVDLLKGMAEKQIRHLPVVDESGRVLGLISRRDAMEAIYQTSLGQLQQMTDSVFRSGAQY